MCDGRMDAFCSVSSWQYSWKGSSHAWLTQHGLSRIPAAAPIRAILMAECLLPLSVSQLVIEGAALLHECNLEMQS
eukprot:1273842-Amphidinium_carterae.1